MRPGTYMPVELVGLFSNIVYLLGAFLQYWPARGTENYGVMSVTLTDTQELATYVIRTFQLQRVSSVNVSSTNHNTFFISI